jgi:hypothetical protein
VPVLVVALPYGAALLSRAAPGVVGARRMAVMGIAVLAAVTLVHIVYLSNSGFPERSYRRDMVPYAGLAEEIRKAGSTMEQLWRLAGGMAAICVQSCRASVL